MEPAILALAVLVLVPTLLVLGGLAVVGSFIAAASDATGSGLVRPRES